VIFFEIWNLGFGFLINQEAYNEIRETLLEVFIISCDINRRLFNPRQRDRFQGQAAENQAG
jgi:hypothetical protein